MSTVLNGKEGSIAEGYIAKECMTLCSRYLKESKTKFNTFEQNCDNGFEKSEGEISIFTQCGRGIGAGMSRNLNDDEWEKAHIFILKNCDEVQLFLKEYSQIQEISTSQVSEDEWNRKFIIWFKKKVEKMRMQDQHTKYDALLSLSRGPSQYVRCFKGYVANGYRFRIEASDIKSRTQNSGVCVLGDIGNETNFVDYYGVLTEILELQYLDEKRLVLFRCFWFWFIPRLCQFQLLLSGFCIVLGIFEDLCGRTGNLSYPTRILVCRHILVCILE